MLLLSEHKIGVTQRKFFTRKSVRDNDTRRLLLKYFDEIFLAAGCALPQE